MQNHFRRNLKPKSSGEPADFLVIGLGNPGEQYARTRHNVGRDALDILTERHHAPLRRGMGPALWSHTRLGMGGDAATAPLVAFGFPGSFMNLSGEGVASLVRRYGIEDIERVIVLHDEIDLPVGRVHIKVGGGLAGHNGLKSIKHHVKSDGFVRVRIGVGRPAHERHPVADYVLSRPTGDDRIVLDRAIETAADAVDCIITNGITNGMANGLVTAMNRFNAQGTT